MRHAGVDVVRVAVAAVLGVLATVCDLSSPAPRALAAAADILMAATFVLAGVTLGLRYGDAAIDHRDYFARRLLRVVPLFTLLLLFRAYGARGEFSFEVWVEAFTSWGYFPDALVARKGSLASPGWLLGPLLQMYLLFPCIHGFFRARGPRWVAGLLFMVLMGRMVARVMGTPPWELASWSMLGRLDAFVLGYLATQIWRGGRRIATIAGLALVVGALGLALPDWQPGIGETTGYRMFRPLLLGATCAGAALGLLQLTRRTTWRLPSALVPALLGAQLFWLPVMDMVTKRGLVGFAPGPLANALLNAALVVVPLALAIGALARVAFELPIRRKILEVLDGRVPTPAVAAPEVSSGRSRNIGHLVALDHLRAFAALLVLAYHGHENLGGPVQPGECQGPLWSVILEGHNGVGLFMVLSGFVFSHGAYGRSVRYGPFLYNRLLRVYPLYIWLLLVAASTYRSSLSGSAIAQSLVTLGNLRGSAGVNTVASIAWTLSPEFQFYLLFPLMHQALEGRRAKLWLAAFFGCLFALRWLVFAGSSNINDMVYWTIFGRLAQFMIGMLTARVFHRVGLRRLLFPIGVALMFIYDHVDRGLGGWNSTIPPWLASRDVLQALMWAVFLLGYLWYATRLPWFLSRPLAHLGTVSYSLYLLHYSLLLTFHAVGGTTEIVSDQHWNALIVFALVQLPLLVVVATISYHVIERPFLEMRVRYLGPREPAI